MALDARCISPQSFPRRPEGSKLRNMPTPVASGEHPAVVERCGDAGGDVTPCARPLHLRPRIGRLIGRVIVAETLSALQAARGALLQSRAAGAGRGRGHLTR
jgi:hypothetical protein